MAKIILDNLDRLKEMNINRLIGNLNTEEKIIDLIRVFGSINRSDVFWKFYEKYPNLFKYSRGNCSSPYNKELYGTLNQLKKSHYCYEKDLYHIENKKYSIQP